MAFTPTSMADWTRSDLYHNRFLISPDDALTSALNVSEQNGLPPDAVSEAQGKFLNLLVKSIQAHRILEIGTLGGYSTIWLAKALPEDGELVTCEISETYAKIAQTNIDNAGLTNKVKIVIGLATETLLNMKSDSSFDLAFIDADKQSNVEYFVQAKRLVRNGGVIIVDNVVRNGRVADPEQNDPSIEGVRRLLEYIQKDPTVEATTLGTVGEKARFFNIHHLKIGYDIRNVGIMCPLFDQLMTLYIQCLDCQSRSLLQALLNCAPRLQTIIFYKNNWLYFFIASKSVRRIIIREDIYYNVQQCAELCTSTLFSQCEVLEMNLRTRGSVLDLLRKMPNLRVLIFKCERDEWKEEMNQMSLLSKQDELIKWLKHYL